jgi:hypothetical protein
MTQLNQMIAEIMIFTSFLIVIDLILTLIISIAAQIPFSIFTVASLMIPEFGGMFILGGCLMARQPLKDEERFDEDGNMVRSWRYAILGKKLLYSAFFLFIFAGLFTLVGILVIS